MQRFVVIGTCVVAICIAAATVVPSGLERAAQAQSGKSKSKSKSKSGKSKLGKSSKAGKTNTKKLDADAKNLEETFIRAAAELSHDYEKAGDLESSKKLLQTILKVNPKVPGVREQIKKLDEEILTANELEVEIDVSKGWGAPLGRVSQGEPFRISAKGKYKFITNLSVGPDGFPTKDPAKDMAKNVACGALMGLMLDSKGKPGRPFAIGENEEITPKQDGILFLAVNIPPGSRCNGKLRVQLSGNITPF